MNQIKLLLTAILIAIPMTMVATIEERQEEMRKGITSKNVDQIKAAFQNLTKDLVNTPFKNGETPLEVALAYSTIPVAEILRANGANLKGADMIRAIVHAAANDSDFDKLKWLTDHGVRDVFGDALKKAHERKNIRAISLLQLYK